jgi:hypothetical protein
VSFGESPNAVALLCGPLVLFAVTKSAPKVSRTQLLAPTTVGAGKWQVATPQEPIIMLPFAAIEDEQYSTYLQFVAGE